MNESYYAGTSYGVSTTSGLTGAIAAMGLFFWLLSMALGVLMIVSLWKIFKKAGKPGWASIVPIYNVYIMCEIAEKEWWYILLLCVPFVNIYAMVVLYNGMAKRFGKGGGFVVGMILLPVVFFPMLAFGKDATIVNNHPNISNENNMTDNTLGANASAVPNMNGQTAMTTNEMAIENNPVMNEPVMSSPAGSAPFGNTNVAPNLNTQNMQNVQNTSEVQAPTMSQTNDNMVTAPSFDNVVPSMTEQGTVMNNSENSNMNVNIQQDEPVQNRQINQTPVMPQTNDNMVTTPSFDNVAPSMTEQGTYIQNNENAMNFSNQAEMLDINDSPDAQNVIDTNVQTHTSMWSNNNQNNEQM